MTEQENSKSGWDISQEENDKSEAQAVASPNFVSAYDKNSGSRESYEDRGGRGDGYRDSDRPPRNGDKCGERLPRSGDRFDDRGLRGGDRYDDRGLRGGDMRREHFVNRDDRMDMLSSKRRYVDYDPRYDSRREYFDDRRGDRMDMFPVRRRYIDYDPRYDSRREYFDDRRGDRMDMLPSRRRYADYDPRYDSRREYFGGREDSFREKRPRTRQDEAAPNPTLGIFSLSYNLMQREFDDYLAGKLTKFKGTYTTKLILDQMTGKCKGFGFVTFNSIEDSTEAKGVLDNGELLGVPYRVAFSIGEKRTNNFQRRPDEDPTRRDVY